jgi:hypothetical protein
LSDFLRPADLFLRQRLVDWSRTWPDLHGALDFRVADFLLPGDLLLRQRLVIWSRTWPDLHGALDFLADFFRPADLLLRQRFVDWSRTWPDLHGALDFRVADFRFLEDLLFLEETDLRPADLFFLQRLVDLSRIWPDLHGALDFFEEDNLTLLERSFVIRLDFFSPVYLIPLDCANFWSCAKVCTFFDRELRDELLRDFAISLLYIEKNKNVVNKFQI